MAVQVGHPAQELADDHRQARDLILEMVQVCRERKVRRAREIVSLIDMVAGPHWRWEEEGLYPGG